VSESRLDELLQSWSEERDRGRSPSAAQLCRDCPDLTDALRKRIAIVERFEQLVDVEPAEPTLGLQRGDTSQARGQSSMAPPLMEPGKTAVTAPLPQALGDFEPQRVLGEGGMGMVYLALDGKLRRPVAIKVMKKELAVKADSRERFLREARSMAAIEHDHIIAIYAVDEQDDVPFLVMPVLQGESLEARLKRSGRLPLAEACRIGREIASGLAAAHARGLIHRDIKPSNIWLALPAGAEPAAAERADVETTPSGGRVKLLDFGLALAAEGQQHLTQSGAVLGTPAYMAPEQAEGLEVDRRCDLFSLGCVLYQMTTGQRAFGGASVMAVLHSLATHAPRPPRDLNPAMPPALSDLILQLLAKEPSKRPRTAQTVVDALAAIEAGLTAAQDSQAAHLGSDALRDLVRGAPGSRRRLTHGRLALALLILAGLACWTVYELVFRAPDGTLIVPVNGNDVANQVQPRPNGQLVFQDSFDSNEPKATPLFGDRFLAFQHVKGQGRVTGRSPGLLPVIYPKEKLRDFLLEFEFAAPAGNDTRQYGLVFRSAHDAVLGLPSYYALFINPHKGTAVFDCWLEGRWIANKPLSAPPNLLQPGGSNHVRLEAVGPDFRLFINKAFVGEHEDHNLPEAGIFGFFVFSDDAGDNPVFFRDLRVYAVD
jgi:serine/threonine protein kinase